MAYYLPHSSASGITEGDQTRQPAVMEARRHDSMAELKVFWGPEICRIEYLVHLLDTGRIKDPHWVSEATG